MSENATKRFRLSLVNAAEDVPRVIRAYGRACFGEFALVLRPTEHRGVLVLVSKDGAFSWKSNGISDAPQLPIAALAAKDAVALVCDEQKGVAKPGPITLRGQWSGFLHCEGGKPRVELVRKLASYGVLHIESSADGWNWKVERTEKWFTKRGADSGTAKTLVKAVENGLARAMGLLGEACSVRDSRRRAAMDEGYAKEHPVKAAREGKDPTDRIKAKAPRTSKRKATAPDASVSSNAKAPRKPRAPKVEGDAGKDKALLQAFSAAVSNAMSD